MARDNGKRGSYRHPSASLAAQVQSKQSPNADKEASSPATTTNSPADSTGTSIINQFLDHAKVDDDSEASLRHLSDDGYFDSPSESFNEKYPIMAIPGSMPRRLHKKQLVGDAPTWGQMVFLVCLIGFAFFGFWWIMYTGFRDVVLYAVAVGVELVAKLKGA